MKREKELELIDKALDEIRPFLKYDGGDVSFVSLENDIVTVRLEGNCTHCTVNTMTLKVGIENTVKKYLPNIKEIRSIDD
ncbi:NifU family protein [Ichthyobacterium seriolicida]|uniref:Nitrogen-fixing NifU domain-containing protein n=1 Tax=Ichthyobacterium seriolicida TaxID=242600 RepID=A0A1J1E5Q0_9FLAO|nr:NifU family protein [Ichthyobacterium seriolicida]BAV95380.1 nitrogen-fixing NifU domain-containing protein [Ichthyobacterium seriolicida]